MAKNDSHGNGLSVLTGANGHHTKDSRVHFSEHPTAPQTGIVEDEMSQTHGHPTVLEAPAPDASPSSEPAVVDGIPEEGNAPTHEPEGQDAQVLTSYASFSPVELAEREQHLPSGAIPTYQNSSQNQDTGQSQIAGPQQNNGHAPAAPAAHQRASAYAVAQAQLAQVAQSMGLDDHLHAYLSVPQREMIVHFPVRMDSGEMRMFTGFRVHHNTTNGPTKGGIRYHPDVSLDECRALAMWMSWKCSLMNLPYGGAKGGVIVDPRKLSAGELERLTRRYTTEITPFIGPERDIPAPDVGTNAQIMAWIMDTYSLHKGHSTPAVVTGKPVAVGGTAGREYATGLGITYVTRAVLKQRMGLSIDRATVAIQGFGNVGSWTARTMDERGARVVAVSDQYGGIYNSNGLDPRRLMRHVAESGTVTDYADGDALTNAELLELDVDVLVPAALEGQITRENAARVRARVIAEGANGPVTPDAERILLDAGTVIVPDILCNAGGVVVSYFEWVQGLQSFFWDEGEVRHRMEQKLLDNLDEVIAKSVRSECDLRTAAYTIAIRRIIEAVQLRGFYP